MRMIAYRLGYVSGWLWHREGMPLDISIGDQLVVGGTVILTLLGLAFL